jgi:hypothetical protein
MKKTIDINELKKELSGYELSSTQPIADGVLEDGRRFQVQVIITTEEDDFIEPDEANEHP